MRPCMHVLGTGDILPCKMTWARSARHSSTARVRRREVVRRQLPAHAVSCDGSVANIRVVSNVRSRRSWPGYTTHTFDCSRSNAFLAMMT